MAVQLTTGRYKPPAPAAPGVSAFSLPGSQYGGQYQYPGAPKTGAAPITWSAGASAGPTPPTTKIPGGVGVMPPTIQAPTASPGYWETPDYSSMIGGSWEVGAAESAMGSQMSAARAAFQSQLRQAFIDLGYTGDTGKGSQLGDFSKYIDKDTIQKAIDNKYSAYAQIQKQQTAASDVNAALALSQGLTGSGSATAEDESLQSQVEQGRYSSLRDFLSGGQTGLSNLSTMQAQLAAGVAQARAAAASRLAAMYPPTWHDPYAPPTPAPYDPNTDPYFPGGPAAPNYPLVGTQSKAWLDWLKEHGTSGY